MCLFWGSKSSNSLVALRRGGEILGNEQWSGYEIGPSRKTTDVNAAPVPPSMRPWREATVVKTVGKRFPQNMLMIKGQLATFRAMHRNFQTIETKTVKSN